MPQNTFGNMSILIQLMARCREQATIQTNVNFYLSRHIHGGKMEEVTYNSPSSQHGGGRIKRTRLGLNSYCSCGCNLAVCDV